MKSPRPRNNSDACDGPGDRKPVSASFLHKQDWTGTHDHIFDNYHQLAECSIKNSEITKFGSFFRQAGYSSPNIKDPNSTLQSAGGNSGVKNFALYFPNEEEKDTINMQHTDNIYYPCYNSNEKNSP